MEARQVIKPVAPGQPPFLTYDDPNRLKVAMPHWIVAAPLKIAAAGNYAAKKVEINVPKNLHRRTLYAGIVNSTADSTDFGSCLGQVNFFLGGKAELQLPFDYNPLGVATLSKEIGLHLNPNVATTPANTLAVDVAGTNNTAFLVPFRVRVACERIAIEMDRGTVGAVDVWIILACLSEGDE